MQILAQLTAAVKIIYFSAYIKQTIMLRDTVIRKIYYVALLIWKHFLAWSLIESNGRGGLDLERNTVARYILKVLMEKTASYSAGLQLFHIFVEGECLLQSVPRPTHIFLTTAGLISPFGFSFPPPPPNTLFENVGEVCPRYCQTSQSNSVARPENENIDLLHPPLPTPSLKQALQRDWFFANFWENFFRPYIKGLIT